MAIKTKIRLLIIKILYILILSIDLNCRVYSQKKIGSIKNYTTDNGLPQNSVKDIEFDKNGYCWLATEVGLVRFDGSNFKLFNTNNKNSTRSSFFITNKQNEMYAYMEFPYMYDLEIDNDENVKFVRDNFYQFEYSRLGYKFNKKWLYNWINQLEINKNEINSGRFTVGIDEYKAYLLHYGKLYFLNKNEVISISIDKNKTFNFDLGFLIDENLIFQYKNLFTVIKNGKLIAEDIPITGDILNDKNIKEENLFYWCQNGTYLFKNKKLYFVTLKNNSIHTDLIFEDLPFSTMQSINYNPILDKYFIGTATKGLFVITGSKFQISKITNENELENVFYGQAIINGNIFANGHLFLKNGKTLKTNVPSFKLNLLSVDGNKLYYTSKFNESNLGIYDFNLKKNKIISTGTIQNIRSIKYNPYDSSIYISTDFTIGKLVKEEIKKISANNESPFRTINFINKDSIIVAKSNGVYIYNLKTQKYFTLISGGEFRSIYQDKLKNWWLGSYGYGYYVWNKKGLVKLPLDKRERLKNVHSFHVDKNNLMWMSTNNGLIAANLKELLAYRPNEKKGIFYRILDKTDGLLSDEFNGGCDPSNLVLKNGEVSYPSMEGLVRFSPESIKFSEMPSKLYFDAIFCNNEPVKISDQIVFPKESKQIIFEVSSPYFEKKEELNIVYKLGDDAITWLAAKDNKLILNELPEGEYNLYMKINNNEKSLKKIPFIIEPYFYQTRWFLVLMILLVSLSIWRIIKSRINETEKKNIILEKLVNDRTYELKNTIINLDKSMATLEKSESEMSSLVVVQNKILNLVLHDLKSPLIFLNHLAKDTLIYFNEKNIPETKKSLVSLSVGIDEIMNFSNSFFEWIYYQRNGLKPVIENINLQKKFEELDLLFTSMKTGNKFIFEKTNISLKSDKNIITTILRNLIDNANKNTQNGTVNVGCSLEKDKVVIVISDNGKGISQEKINMIEGVFSKKISSEKLSGFGYKIIIELLELLQSKLQIQNKDKGTEVRIILPQNTEDA